MICQARRKPTPRTRASQRTPAEDASGALEFSYRFEEANMSKWAGHTLLLLITITVAAQDGGKVPKSDVSKAYSVLGIDVSRYQQRVDFKQVGADHVSYVFIKATEGHRERDPYYSEHLRQARQAQLAVGSYHFYLTNVAADLQFENFVNTADIRTGDLPPVVDIEIVVAGSPANWQEGLRQFLVQLERWYAVRPIIYSGSAFAAAHLAAFSAYPLWIAEYGVASPRVPAAWPHYTFWQFSQNCQVPGVRGAVDCNRFRGTRAALEQLRLK